MLGVDQTEDISSERGVKMAQEKRFENKVKKFLKDQNCYFVKYWGGGQFTKSGVPDILCCCNGYFVGVELKADNGTPSELQLFNVREINKTNGFAFILYPSAFEHFKKFIEDLNKDVFDRDAIPEIWK